jgi:hypothetical protein
MILGRDFFKKIVIIVSITACFTLAGLPVFAASSQENPDTAAVVFSGVSLFQFYSGTLDSVLAKNQQDIETDIQVSPFANVPPAVEDSFNNFLSSAGNLCSLILGLDGSVSDTKLLLQESRYTEAASLYTEAFTNLAIAEENLDSIKQAASIAGSQFKVTGVSTDSSISVAYTAVQGDIQRLSDLLNLYRTILQQQQTEISNKSLLPSSDITIGIDQSEAYVGDTVSFRGTLSANGQLLGNRRIEILLDGSLYLTVNTDSQGHYFGSFQVPYWYVSLINIQSLYFPQAGDVGNYDLALSPSVSLKILFYTAVLTLRTATNAYSGRDIDIIGQFEYGASPVVDERNIEISLDNVPFVESEVSAAFTQKIALPADTTIGNHLITVSVLAEGRYSPVVASVNLTVVKAIPVLLTTKLPFAVMIPGSFHVRGKLTSSIGPVSQARVTITFEGKQVSAVSGDDGTFNAVIRNSMGFGLFGSQSLQITSTPMEPWQTTVAASHNVITVYVVNCSVFFLILVFLGIILPRRLKFRIVAMSKKKLPQAIVVTAPDLPTSAVSSVAENLAADIGRRDESTPVGRLFYWYRVVILLVQKVSGLLLKPNQTLREYISDTGQATGSTGKIILEFTRIVEKVLYSHHQVTEDDIKNGQQLARKVRESIGK